MTDRLPYVYGSPTSMQAALNAQDKAKQLRVLIYNFILSQGDNGSTRDEVEIALGHLHQTSSARIRDLVRMGCLIERQDMIRSTRSGRSAVVCIAVPGTDPSASPPQYDPVANAVARLADLISRGITSRDEVVQLLDDAIDRS